MHGELVGLRVVDLAFTSTAEEQRVTKVLLPQAKAMIGTITCVMAIFNNNQDFAARTVASVNKQRLAVPEIILERAKKVAQPS